MRPSCLRWLPLLLGLAACRTYDSYAPVADQAGLIPAARFARYGREQADLVAIGRSLAAWKMTSAPDDLVRQAAQARCFALRLPEVDRVDPDPQGHRLTVTFKSGWRAGVVPVTDGVEPSATPGIGPLLPPPAECR
jgi:crotonobetainyl-CoA:carnitine CoA-transferase CaiB-like acyl-CoA transferase